MVIHRQEVSMNARKLLLVVALVFGITETIDIPHTGAPAAVFAVLFFGCAAWLWRRNSLVAAAILTLQFLVEVGDAHTWKGVSMPLKVSAMVLGTIGLAAAAGFFVSRIRRGRLEAADAARIDS
jgi:hypothetical protein